MLKTILITVIINIATTIALMAINNHNLEKQNLQVAYINLDQIYKDFIINTAKNSKEKNNQEAEVIIKQEGKLFNQAINILTKNLTKISKQQNLIILNKSNILAGGEDHTEKFKSSLDQIIKHLKK